MPDQAIASNTLDQAANEYAAIEAQFQAVQAQPNNWQRFIKLPAQLAMQVGNSPATLTGKMRAAVGQLPLTMDPVPTGGSVSGLPGLPSSQLVPTSAADFTTGANTAAAIGEAPSLLNSLYGRLIGRGAGTPMAQAGGLPGTLLQGKTLGDAAQLAAELKMGPVARLMGQFFPGLKGGQQSEGLRMALQELGFGGKQIEQLTPQEVAAVKAKLNPPKPPAAPKPAPPAKPGPTLGPTLSGTNGPGRQLNAPLTPGPPIGAGTGWPAGQPVTPPPSGPVLPGINGPGTSPTGAAAPALPALTSTAKQTLGALPANAEDAAIMARKGNELIRLGKTQPEVADLIRQQGRAMGLDESTIQGAIKGLVAKRR